MPGPFSPRAAIGTGQGTYVTVYTAPATGGAVSRLQLTNDTAGVLSGRVFIVPKGDTRGAKHVFIPLTPIAAGDYLETAGGISIGDSATVVLEADAGLVCTVFGTEL